MVKLRLPCQILGQHQSRPPGWTVSCWGRSLGHSIGCLTAWMATQALGMNTIWASSAVPSCRVQSEAVGIVALLVRGVWLCLALRGSRHLGCAGSPHWVTGYLAGHCLTWGCLLSPFGLIWKGVELPERQKLDVSSHCRCSGSMGEALWVLVHSARNDALVTAEGPSDGPDSGDFWDLNAASVSLFCFKFNVFQDLGLGRHKKWSWKAINEQLYVLSL